MPLIPYFARIQFDFGAQELLATELENLKVRRPLVMTDRGVRDCGLMEKAVRSIAVRRPPIFDAVASDPHLTLQLPPQVTAGTGIDAFSHAVESFLSPAINPAIDAIALDAAGRLWAHLPIVIAQGTDRQARWEVMMGATEAGMCFWKGL